MSMDIPANPLMMPATSNFERQSVELQNKLLACQNDKGDNRFKELKKSTQEFEALFVGYMLKVMRSTVDESEDEEGSSLGKGIYQEMFDNELALFISSSNSVGIAEMVYKQLEEKIKKQDETVEGVKEQQEELKKTDSSSNLPDKAIVPKLADSSQSDKDLISDDNANNSFNILPTDGVVSSPYGLRIDPFNKKINFHHGVDIAASVGAPIQAVQAGEVVYSGNLHGYGNTVIVEHANGYRTLYAHTAQNYVSNGDRVKEAQVIGVVGNSGRSTGPHLHFELQKEGISVNPGMLLSHNHTQAVDSGG